MIEFGGPEDLSLLDCIAELREVVGRRIRAFHLPFGFLGFIGRAARPFTEAWDALFEIVEFVEQRGLRADKKFLADYPIQLTSFRSFLRQQLGLSIGPG